MAYANTNLQERCYTPLILLVASENDKSKTGRLIPIFMKCKSFVHFCKIMKRDLRYLSANYKMRDLRKKISSIKTVYNGTSIPTKKEYMELMNYCGYDYEDDWETLLDKCQGSLVNTIMSGYSYSQINCVYDKRTLMKNLEYFVNKIKKYNPTANMSSTFIFDFDNDNITFSTDHLGDIFENDYWDDVICEHSSSSDSEDYNYFLKNNCPSSSSSSEDKKTKSKNFSKNKKSSSSSSYDDKPHTKNNFRSKSSKKRTCISSSSDDDRNTKKDDYSFSSSSADDTKKKGILKSDTKISNKPNIPVQNNQLKSITGVDVKKLQKFSKYRAYVEYRIFIQQKLSELSMNHPEISALELYTRADMEWLRKYSN
jgi:hypothetical protein